MNTLDELLAEFETRLLPHERFFIGQGLIAFRPRPAPELPPNHHANSYLTEKGQQERLRAHQLVGGTLHNVQAMKAGAELPPSAFGELVLWAVVEFGLGCVESFVGFALLVAKLTCQPALIYAPALFAAAALHPLQVRMGLLNAASLADVAVLQAVLRGQISCF